MSPEDIKKIEEATRKSLEKVRLYHLSHELYERPDSKKLRSFENGWGYYANDGRCLGSYGQGNRDCVVYYVDVAVKDFFNRWLHKYKPIGEDLCNKIKDELKKAPEMEIYFSDLKLTPSTEGFFINRTCYNEKVAKLLTRAGVDGYVINDDVVFYDPENVPIKPYEGHGKYAGLIKTPEHEANITNINMLLYYYPELNEQKKPELQQPEAKNAKTPDATLTTIQQPKNGFTHAKGC